MNLQKISLPENPGLFKQDLYHLGMSPRTSALSSDIFSAVSTKYLPGPYRDTDINIAWRKSR